MGHTVHQFHHRHVNTPVLRLYVRCNAEQIVQSRSLTFFSKVLITKVGRKLLKLYANIHVHALRMHENNETVHCMYLPYISLLLM